MTTEYDHLFNAAGQKYGVSPRLLKAIAAHESSFNPKASSGVAYGLMQFTKDSAKRYNIDPYDPAQAIDGAARLLSDNAKRFDNDVDAIRAYHGGPDKSNWGVENAPYYDDVMKQYAALENDPITTGSSSKSSYEKKAEKYKQEWASEEDSGAPVLDPDLAGAFEEPPAKKPVEPVKKPVEASLDPELEKAFGGESSSVAKTAAVPQTVESPKTASTLPTNVNKLDALKTVGENLATNVQGGLSDVVGSYATGEGTIPTALRSVVDPVEIAKLPAVQRAYVALTDQELPTDYKQQLASMSTEDARKAVSSENLQRLSTLDAENAKFKELAGGGLAPEIVSGFGRAVGQTAATAPLVAGGLRALGTAGSMATKVPAVQTAVTGLSQLPVAQKIVNPLINFASGKLASNRLVSPLSGRLIQEQTAGNYLGQMASKATAGSLLSVPYTQLTQAGSADSYEDQLRNNALTAGVVGAASLPVKSVFRYGGEKLGQLAGALTGGKVGSHNTNLSPDQIASQYIAEAAGDPTLATEFSSQVPGVHDTLSRKTGNAGVAKLEKYFSGTNTGRGPLVTTGADIADLAEHNAQQRINYLTEATGTPDEVKAGRDELAKLYEKHEATMFKDSKPVDINKAVTELKDWFSNTDTRLDDEVKAVGKEYLSKLEAGVGTAPATAPSYNRILKGVVPRKEDLSNPSLVYKSFIKPINDTLNDPKITLSPAKREALSKVKEVLDNHVQDAAQGYRAYLQDYAQAVKPNIALDWLVKRNIVDPDKGTISLGKLMRTIKQIEDRGKLRNANYKSGENYVSEEQLAKLKAVKADLVRDYKLQKKIKTPGSDTHQNLLTGQRIENELNQPAETLLSSSIRKGVPLLGYGAGQLATNFLTGGVLPPYVPHAVGALAGLGSSAIGNKLANFFMRTDPAKNEAIREAIGRQLLGQSNFIPPTVPVVRKVLPGSVEDRANKLLKFYGTQFAPVAATTIQASR